LSTQKALVGIVGAKTSISCLHRINWLWLLKAKVELAVHQKHQQSFALVVSSSSHPDAIPESECGHASLTQLHCARGQVFANDNKAALYKLASSAG
jgi:hypothetical protein